LQQLRGAPLALTDRFGQRLVEKVFDATQQRTVGATAQAATLLVRGAQCQKRRLLELEGVVGLSACTAPGQRPCHPDRLERLLFHVVRLLGVERENLERDVGLRYEQAGDGL